jgi:hypothetical protein
MAMRFLQAGPAFGKALLPAASACLLLALPQALAQKQEKTQDSTRLVPEKSHPDRLPERPSSPPAFSIPLEPLGFAPPGSIYLGQRYTLASLDFLDEDRLLFTFRVPGLIHRQSRAGDEDESQQRHIKAVVLSLPSGTVEAEAVWMLHDRGHYLWMLGGGRFLLRDRNELSMGDASLELKPFLRFPGPLLSVGMDPARQFLVTNSREPASSTPKSGVPGPAKTTDVSVGSDPPGDAANGAQPNMVLRVLERESGKVVVVSRVRSSVDLPINSDGYLELLPGKGPDWVINLNGFTGGSRTLGQVDSTCSPSYDFVSQSEFLVTTCTRSDLRALVAMGTDGRKLWEDLPTSSPVWPLLITGADGSRLARESLAVSHPVTAFSPLGLEDVRGQLVEVFDSATGKIVLTAPVSPVLDAGGNVAISPSGRRAAVLSAGAIQVFDLPAPPAPPAVPGPAASAKAGH